MSVLDDIIVGVRQDTQTRKLSVSLADLKVRVTQIAPALPVVPLLQRPGVQLIAEVKRSSPSKGVLADIADPAALASAYEAGGASAISVLTEQRRFGGSLADLDAVRAAVRIPILRKDFMVEEYQFWEARAHGADIILLIVAGLEQSQLVEFMSLTRELGMTALVETHDEDEIARALAAGAEVIGVNARNLKTLEVDRGVFQRVVNLIPSTCVRIAESGVRSPEDVVTYGEQGADVVLVGEALVTGAEPQTAARAMIEAGAMIGKAS